MTLDLTRPHKRVEFTIKISANRQSTINGGEEFFTMDSGGTAVGVFNFEIENLEGQFEPLNLTNVKEILIGFDFIVADSSVVLEPEILDVENGRVALVLPNQFEYSGTVLGYTYIIWKDGREQDAGTFQLTFTESWLDKELPEMEDFYVSRFEGLREEIRLRVEEIKAEMDRDLKTVKQDITTAQSDINKIQSQIDDNDIVGQSELNNLASVGRNLLTNGRTPTLNNNNNATNQSSREVITENGITFIRCTMIGGTEAKRISMWTAFPRTQIAEDLAGKTVELTHKIRANKEHRAEILDVRLYGGDGDVSLPGNGTLPIATLPTNWQTIRHVVTIPETYSRHTGLRFNIWGGQDVGIGDWVDFRDWSISIVDDKWSLPVEDLRPISTPLPLANTPQIGSSGQFADAAHVHQMPTASQVGALPINGNAVSASRLTTARNIALSGGVTGSASFDGSANMTISAAVPPTGHIHGFDQLRGMARGLAAGINLNTVYEGGTYRVSSPTNAPAGSGWYYFEVIQQGSSECLQRASRFDIPWEPWVRSCDSSGTWRAWERVRASSANTLATSRTINGTSFNGSGNITTTNWGTARNITIGNTTRSVNGSANLSWTLANIGAMPIAGGTFTDAIAINGTVTNNSTGRGAWWTNQANAAGLGAAQNSGDTRARYRGHVHTGQVADSVWAPFLSMGYHRAGLAGTWSQGIIMPNADWVLANYSHSRNTNGTDTSFTFGRDGRFTASLGRFTDSITAPRLIGNADTATQLQNTRNITIGNTTKSFNGTANVGWSLAEIGALGINATANSAMRLAFPVMINGVPFDGSSNINVSPADSGWINLTLNPDWEVAENDPPRIRRNGSVVFLQGAAQPVSGANIPNGSSGTSAVTTLPTGFRPENTVRRWNVGSAGATRFRQQLSRGNGVLTVGRQFVNNSFPQTMSGVFYLDMQYLVD